MYFGPITARRPLTADEIAHMSAEELNYEGAHFQHIVDRNNRDRGARINAENSRVYALLERRGDPVTRRAWRG